MPAPPAPAPPSESQSTYPNLEGFVEHASREDLDELFARLKESLGSLKGPRSEQAKKAKVAVERTEELLGRLLELRENLAELRQKPMKKPR